MIYQTFQKKYSQEIFLEKINKALSNKIFSIIYEIMLQSPGGGIGRHKGLKIPRRRLRAGSSPAPGTK